jgi:hypothetical protein
MTRGPGQDTTRTSRSPSDRLTPVHRLFGEITTRTRNPTLEPPADAAERARSRALQHQPKLPLEGGTSWLNPPDRSGREQKEVLAEVAALERIVLVGLDGSDELGFSVIGRVARRAVVINPKLVAEHARDS